MAKYEWYNNGTRNIKVYPDTNIPEDFHKGYLVNTNSWNKGLTKETDSRLICSETTRQKHREQNIGENNPMYGKHHSEVTRAKLSEYHKGKSSWNKGLTKDTHSSLKSASEKQTGHKFYVDMTNKLEKEKITKKKNNFFNKSKPEDDYYKYLLTLYSEDDIERQYSDDRYSFSCDFYIKSEDLFIECNYHWTHGGQSYDESNETCRQKLNEWVEKSKNSKFYENAIYTWTDLDVRKQAIANKNNLNYKTLYK